MPLSQTVAGRLELDSLLRKEQEHMQGRIELLGHNEAEEEILIDMEKGRTSRSRFIVRDIKSNLESTHDQAVEQPP